MYNINKAIICGRLGADPDSRTMNDGSPVVNLSVATSQKWKDKATGAAKEAVQWHKVVIFNEGLANVASQYLKKGSAVYIEGAMQTRKWTDQQGNDKFTTEIVLQRFRGELGLMDGKSGGGQGSAQGGSQDHAGGNGGSTGGPADLDDEIPFN